MMTLWTCNNRIGLWDANLFTSIQVGKCYLNWSKHLICCLPWWMILKDGWRAQICCNTKCLGRWHCNNPQSCRAFILLYFNYKITAHVIIAVYDLDMALCRDSLFRGADGIDKLLMLFGMLGSFGEGSMSPMTMLALSSVMNRYGGDNSYLTNDVIDKVSDSTPKILLSFML